MIQKTRRKLVWGYTLAIIAILALSFLAGIIALNYFIQRAMINSLIPELEGELVESKPVLHDWVHNVERTPSVTHFDSYELAFTVMEYWFSPEGELVMAEGSEDVSDMLMERIKVWNHPNRDVHELKFYDDQGKAWEFIVISDEVYDDNGMLLGRVIVGTNMTPLTRITEQYMRAALVMVIIVSLLAFIIGNYFAAKAVKPIEAAMQKQRNFVSDASHELRTPLSVMLASVDMLTPVADDAVTVSDVRAEIMNMRNLVNSLLILARSDNAEDSLAFSDFDLCAVAQNETRRLQYLADAKNIKIVYGCPVALLMHGDETKIRQLLNILLDNAIKYSGANMVVMLDISQKHNNAVISVQDYGMGIAAHDLANIFERFYRTDKARSRSVAQGGFGLGLSIARLIADVHKGEIKVVSTPGKGSTFTVTLPLGATGK